MGTFLVLLNPYCNTFLSDKIIALGHGDPQASFPNVPGPVVFQSLAIPLNVVFIEMQAVIFLILCPFPNVFADMFDKNAFVGINRHTEFTFIARRSREPFCPELGIGNWGQASNLDRRADITRELRELCRSSR